MAESNTISSAELCHDVRQKVEGAETGLYTIATDQGIAVLIGLTRGNVPRLHCRSMANGQVIEVLRSGDAYRLRFMPATEDSDPVLMSGRALVDALESGPEIPGAYENFDVLPSAPEMAVQSGAASHDLPDNLRAQLVDITSEYIGLAAEILVDDALARHADLQGIIRYVRDGLPDAEFAGQFDDAIRSAFMVLDLE